MFEELILTVGVIAAWVAAVVYLQSIGFWAKHNFTAVGPLLMWKTVRGRALIDRIARHTRLWRVYGDLSIGLVALAMVGITGLLVWEATLVPSIPPDRVPPPQTILGIPGINPIIPIWYGIAGLAVAIFLHEFLHGVLTRVSRAAIRSLGILLFVVPVGAFVEPDEEQLKALPRRERARLFAVGPSTNLILALGFALVFSGVFMAGVQPVHAGVGITGYANAGSPAEAATCIANCEAFSGGLLPQMVIVAVNGTPTTTYPEFRSAMDLVRPGQTITVAAWDHGTVRAFSVTPAASSTGGAILGIYGLDTTTEYYHPIQGATRFGGIGSALIVYISLPFQGRAPLQAPATDFYVISGPFAALPAWLFWILANLAYWMFWLNLMLGITNALPAVPLDGGYVFRDGLGWLFERRGRAVRVGGASTAAGLAAVAAAFVVPSAWAALAFGGVILVAAGVAILLAGRERKGARRPEAWVRGLSYGFALLVLGLILWQFLGPRVLNLTF